MTSFEVHLMTLYTVRLPPGGLVFDYFVDAGSGAFTEWTTTVLEFTYDASAPYFQLVVPTVDTVRYSYVIDHLIDVNKPVFITGVTGTGKTVLGQISSRARTMFDEGGKGVVPVFINFSAQTPSIVTQSSIEGNLEKEAKEPSRRSRRQESHRLRR